MKNKLLIIGASGHGKVVADIALKMGKWQEIAFLDDDRNLTLSMGLDVVGETNEISTYKDDYEIFVGIGNNNTRKELHEKLVTLGASIPTLIHPNTVISSEVVIGMGTAIMAGAVINCCTTIGNGCIINTGSTVDHDNVIEDFVHISPGANLAGSVSIGHGSWLGIGSVVSNNISITNGCKIGAGAVVVKDITEQGVYIGVPVRRL